LKKNKDTLRLQGFFRYGERMQSHRKARNSSRKKNGGTGVSKSWDEITTPASKECSEIELMDNTEDSSDDNSASNTSSLKDYTAQQLKVRKS
jgi:hypothetical protein